MLKVFGKGRGVIHSCNVVEGASGSPLLLIRDGRVSVLGLHTIRTESKDGGSQAGALTVSVFHPKLGTKAAQTAASLTGLQWGEGRSPGANGTEAPDLQGTIERLLSQQRPEPAKTQDRSLLAQQP